MLTTFLRVYEIQYFEYCLFILSVGQLLPFCKKKISFLLHLSVLQPQFCTITVLTVIRLWQGIKKSEAGH
jgi:hypothetical protein